MQAGMLQSGWLTDRSTPGYTPNSTRGTGTTQLQKAAVAILPARWSAAHRYANFSNLNSKSNYPLLIALWRR